ncbi:helix-turn-helix domain-containing protein [Paenibacillus mucilaginosus]|uniref:AraC family transcriptional regulator n=3 Tax=Paenibacillus mucilaginosus TaxID=61624 RepID=H6NL04_9BACL|nr:helix-turn-helix domain-containing protein [Paenibacillus mucilaginosus]AEI40698.1 two component transcriptional regulator, AraC family [Paenibacillus mucilaginosus KNP414]AFC29310.1 AraC family transcriptional regulator [Paenibacillus mucilaginosus 3016]AFH61488.1 AraC family transcriptional regulator [Paenibacillus mucilaginosus K02]MCG7211817.1 helix-turn-helix domain-containing protein [Paenibacillus mucilaginosus]WDM29834.1 helix-turn-helix domain-containing protein [Paenibacillus muci
MLNAIIADDEKLVRKGFISVIDWEKFGISLVGEAANAKEALILLQQHHVDLLITDITMPGMSGFDLIREARMLYPRLWSVVLTCHHEFDYVQEALRLGAVDYIVKTLLDVEEIDVVMKRITDRIALERQRFGVEVEHPGASETPSYTLALQAGTNGPTPADLRLSMFEPAKEAGPGLWIVPLPGVKSWSDVEELLLPLRHYPWCMAAMRDDEPMGTKKTGEQRESACVSSYLFFESRAGAAPLRLTPGDLSHWEASRVIGREGLTEWKERWLDSRWIFHEGEYGKLLQALESSLFTAGLFREWAAAHFAQWEGIFHAAEDHPEYIRRFGDAVRWSEVKEWVSIYRNEVRQRIQGKFAFSEGVVLSLLAAVKYVQANMGSDVNQNEVAKHVNMSRSYFSQCFKSFMPLSFGGFLRHTRLEKAKELLRAGELPVYRIAETVGFQDEKYFSRVFREHTGSLPSEYREREG